MKDYRLTLKVRNNRILKAIEAMDATLGWKWCAENGLSYTSVNRYINMTDSPLDVEGRLKQSAEKLCDVLGKLPDELWSNEQLYPLEKNFSEMEMDYAQVVSLLPPEQQSYLQDFSEFEQEQTKALLSDAMKTLTFKERDILQMRFNEGLTLDESAERYGLSRERARQIEARALRKMRRPERIGIYVDVLDVSELERKAYKQAAKKFVKEGLPE